MADAETVEFLSRCPSPDRGCFASDPDALEAMLYFDDTGIRIDLLRAAGAATEAAIEGINLEDAKYNPVRIEVSGGVISTGPDGRPRVHDTHSLGMGDEASVLSDETDGIAGIRNRVAHCAYVCGSMAVGCPLRTRVK